MKNVFRAAILVSLAWCGAVCHAEDRNAASLVTVLMQESGLNKQVEQIPSILKAEFDRQRGHTQGLTPEEYERFRRIAVSAFDAKTVLADVRGHIASNLSGDDARTALGWLRSPIGNRITRMEEEASTAEAYADMQKIGPKLYEEYRDTSRFEKLKRLDRAVGATESSVNTVLNIQAALITAIASSMEHGRRPSNPDVREIVRKSRPQVHAAMRRIVLTQFLYTYRDLTENEIDRYIGYAESPFGRRYHSVVVSAIDNALVKATKRFGRRLGRQGGPA